MSKLLTPARAWVSSLTRLFIDTRVCLSLGLGATCLQGWWLPGLTKMTQPTFCHHLHGIRHQLFHCPRDVTSAKTVTSKEEPRPHPEESPGARCHIKNRQWEVSGLFRDLSPGQAVVYAFLRITESWDQVRNKLTSRLVCSAVWRQASSLPEPQFPRRHDSLSVPETERKAPWVASCCEIRALGRRISENNFSRGNQKFTEGSLCFCPERSRAVTRRRTSK